jgi:hypothetical protein
MSFRTIPKLIAEDAEGANGDLPCDMRFKRAVACIADDTNIWSELALARVEDYAAFAVLAQRLAAERRIDLRLALASALAAWATVAVLVARARQAADAKTARRLERDARARRAMLSFTASTTRPTSTLAI